MNNNQTFFNRLVKFYELSSIKTWRNTPSNQKINFTELNHIFMKTSIFLILANYIEEKFNKKINYKEFVNLIISHSLIRNTFKDINVELLEGIDKNNIIDFVIEEYQNMDMPLTKEEKLGVNNYYSNKSLIKELWNLSSTISNELDFKLIKDDPFLLNSEKMENNINKWRLNFKNNNSGFFTKEERNILLNELKNFEPVFKFLYNSSIQKRWNGVDLSKKITIAEHQILVTLTFFKYLELNKDRNLKNNLFIKNNLNNLLFHDIPEIITKDINSPVKRNIKGLRKLLEEKLEQNALDNYFYLNLPEEIKFYYKNLGLDDPFKDKKINGIIINGKLGKAMDDITAYWEAIYNKLLGNKLPNINQAVYRIKNKYIDLAEKNQNNNIFKETINILNNIDKNIKNLLNNNQEKKVNNNNSLNIK